MLETSMNQRRGMQLLAILVIVAVLPSCFLLRVPVETAGTVVTAGAHVAEKTATTTVDVAGKAA